MQQAQSHGLETIQGTVGSVIYSSADSGYTVCEIEGEDGLPAVIVGIIPYIGEGGHYPCYGKMDNPTHLRQTISSGNL